MHGIAANLFPESENGTAYKAKVETAGIKNRDAAHSAAFLFRVKIGGNIAARSKSNSGWAYGDYLYSGDTDSVCPCGACCRISRAAGECSLYDIP